ncbi:MAG TPA: TolC family protein [Candidatus Baltobacteraceae bacterium]|jgi:outer membrane protein|nr:TolC family protein [Candidatus Baltobacteraceae bacterium]
MKKAICFVLVLSAAGSLLATDTPRRLTLQQAQQIALTQHPRISVANLAALAARQATKEVQSAFLPDIYGSATAVDTADPNNTRIAAGALNNPLIYEREADGVTISQLITDFGRTSELSQSAKLRTRAQEMNLEATREQILLEVNNAYFSSLAAQSVLEVAEDTAKSRQLVLQQITTLATNKLKSDLDVSFASVDFDQANILVAKARNDLKASFAVLSALLADREPQTFLLTDEPMPANITNDVSALIFEALGQRPDLARLRYQSNAAKEFAKAEGKLVYPTLSAIGTAGVIPTGNSHLGPDYAAAGVNLNLPLYSGGLYTARRREAQFQAKAAEETLRDEEDNVIRDVQITELNLEYSHQRLALTRQLLQNANEAFELAQARFKSGISSIIELSQAELNQTSAQIAETDARYDYQIQHSALDFQLGRLR